MYLIFEFNKDFIDKLLDGHKIVKSYEMAKENYYSQIF